MRKKIPHLNLPPKSQPHPLSLPVKAKKRDRTEKERKPMRGSTKDLSSPIFELILRPGILLDLPCPGGVS
jgi:hypothetical protein